MSELIIGLGKLGDAAVIIFGIVILPIIGVVTWAVFTTRDYPSTRIATIIRAWRGGPAEPYSATVSLNRDVDQRGKVESQLILGPAKLIDPDGLNDSNSAHEL